MEKTIKNTMMEKLTTEQKEIVNEILKKENPQTKVDKIVKDVLKKG